MEYKFNQKLTKEDYVAFVTNHMRFSLLRPTNLVLFVVSVGYLVASPFILENNDFTFTYIGLAIIALLVGMIFLSRRNAGKQFEKNSKQFDATFTIDENKVIYALQEGQIEKNWFDFYSVYEKGEYIYLYVQKNSGLVIVTRDLAPEIVDFIKEQAKKHVNARRMKLK